VRIQSESAQQKDWTQGSVVGNLISLSWPLVITQSLNTLGPVIDTIWIGRLGAAAIAGVGISQLAVQMINATMMGLGIGMRAMIARFIGAGDHEGANHVAKQAFLVSIIFLALAYGPGLIPHVGWIINFLTLPLAALIITSAFLQQVQKVEKPLGEKSVQGDM